jgi:ribosomal-protein-serine acetyltransferase
MRVEVMDGCEVRLLEEADGEELYGLVEANRSYLAEWLPWAADQTLEGTAEFIRKTRKQYEDNDGLQGGLVLDGRMVGAGGLLGVNWEARRTGIGYWLAEEHQGRGLMTRAVQAVADYAFDELELNRVEIEAAVGNRRSRAIPERLGFQQEGILRDYERVGDRYLDIVVYSLLANERQHAASSRRGPATVS